MPEPAYRQISVWFKNVDLRKVWFPWRFRYLSPTGVVFTLIWILISMNSFRKSKTPLFLDNQDINKLPWLIRSKLLFVRFKQFSSKANVRYFASSFAKNCNIWTSSSRLGKNSTLGPLFQCYRDTRISHNIGKLYHFNGEKVQNDLATN